MDRVFQIGVASSEHTTDKLNDMQRLLQQAFADGAAWADTHPVDAASPLTQAEQMAKVYAEAVKKTQADVFAKSLKAIDVALASHSFVGGVMKQRICADFKSQLEQLLATTD